MIAALREEHPEWPISAICRVLDVARSSYYYSDVEVDEVELRDSIERIALEFPRYGYRRMTVELSRRGLVANHKRVLRLMREGNLLVNVQRFCRTTNSEHRYGRHPNLIKGLPIELIDQAWCADIT